MTSIRDDAGLRSLSRNERAFTRACALPLLLASSSHKRRPLRVDGRSLEQVRPVRLHLGRWDHGSECTVQWGNTRVTALCTAELVRPNLDRPSEGQLVISVDLSPSASPSFRQAPPFTTGGGGGGGGGNAIPNFASQAQRLLSNRILRCIEKIIVVGGTLDLEALCLIPSQWVWRFQLALTVLDDGGNIIDAAVMASIASLRHYRKPQVDLDGGGATTITQLPSSSSEPPSNHVAMAPVLIPSHLKEPTPLPLHHTPLSISFAFVPMEDGSTLSTTAAAVAAANNTTTASSSSSSGIVAALVDPTDREELIQSGSLTVGMNVHAEVCLLDYGGGCELPPSQLEDCWNKAQACIRPLCHMLETSLEEADQQAQRDRLAKLVQQQQQQQQWSSTSDNTATTATTFVNTITSDDGLPPLPTDNTSPYFQHSENPVGDDNLIMMDIDKVFNRNNADDDDDDDAHEEAYRKKLLDFNEGYQTTKVRDDNDHMQHSSKQCFSMASKFMKDLFEASSAAKSATKTTASDDDDNAGTTTSSSQNQAPVVPSPPSVAINTNKQDTTTTKKSIKASTNSISNINKLNLSAGQIDSDEEDSTLMLQSEFPNEPPSLTTPAEADLADATTSTTIKETKTEPMEEDDDIDDLAMAMTNKKKKKKKKK